MDYFHYVDWGIPLIANAGTVTVYSISFRQIRQWKKEHPSSDSLITPIERLKSVFFGTIVVTLLTMVCFWFSALFSHIDAALVWTNPWDWVLSAITGLLSCGDYMLDYACKRIDKLKGRQENQTSLNDLSNSISLKDAQSQQIK
jgi:hypothetical protein